MIYKFHDGGRAVAGFKGVTGDCAARALAIADDVPYQAAYDLINQYAKTERRKKKSSARSGVWVDTFKRVMHDRGFEWVALAGIGKSAPQLSSESIPRGRVIARTMRHYCAIVDHVIYDNHDPRDNGFGGCKVYGYWIKR